MCTPNVRYGHLFTVNIQRPLLFGTEAIGPIPLVELTSSLHPLIGNCKAVIKRYLSKVVGWEVGFELGSRYDWRLGKEPKTPAPRETSEPRFSHKP